MKRRQSLFVNMVACCLIVSGGCGSPIPVPQDIPQGVVIKQPEMDALHEELSAKVTSANTESMTNPGLVGTLGGARVKLLKSGTHEVVLPLPQLADGQIPLCYYMRTKPRDAAVEYRLLRREELNDVVRVQLKGESNQEIELEWSSVVLTTDKPVSSSVADPVAYKSATGCVQADASEIKELAEDLWPESGEVDDYARNIQRYVRDMKRAKQPRSLDALGILDSGMNTICTANANLALALMRAKGIRARSMAVIPPTSQRLEMHRIVEYNDKDLWHYFDPSSLHADVPMKPWQTVIMAITTESDENLAMKPRMGAMVGCPYGQELELLSPGITLWGQEFFWTIAKPLAVFQPDDEAVTLAKDAWKQYLDNGALSAGQISAAAASDSTDFLNTLKAK